MMRIRRYKYNKNTINTFIILLIERERKPNITYENYTKFLIY